MVNQRYFEKYFIVDWVEKISADITTFIPTDGDVVMGLFVQNKSNETMAASAEVIQTHGRISVNENAPINNKDTLRRASDGLFFSITSDPIKAPSKAMNKIKVYQASVTDRPDEYMERDGDG